MKELIKVNMKNINRPTVLGRDLYDFLDVKTKYIDWFERMLKYGFEKDKDFIELSQKKEGSEGQRSIKRTIINHQLTLNMAKEIGMIQRNEKGKQIRKYFIKCEDTLKNIIKVKTLNKNDKEWQKIRQESKKVRFEETEEIKRLVEYARKNGSENAEKYYTLYSNLIWKHLFDCQVKSKNKKDLLNSKQLHIMMQGEYIIKNKISEGMKNEIDYHDIYKSTKYDIASFSNFIEITKIPYYTQLSLI